MQDSQGMAKKTKKVKIDDLNQIYSEADQLDQEVFAEQRSNILLISGEHYTKKGSKFWNRIRDQKQLSSEQKIRLTKNHIQKITKTYVNNITTFAPGVGIAPSNKTELQDQKSADLNQSVWHHAKAKYKLRKKTREWAKDFVDIGEVGTKIFWDPSAGDFQGYTPELDEMGQQVLDENGQPAHTGEAIFSGDFVFERLYGMNLLRAPDAQNMQDSKLIIIRKMVGIADLKAQVGKDQEKLSFIQASSDETYTVFDAASGSYKKSEKEIMLREYYYRPCVEYPQGYFYITTKSGILFEGELPFGIFPICFEAFDEIQTSPRGRSIVKVLRPYQAEINRSASKIAEHQITLGDDKIFLQNGTKVGQSQILPGVRAYTYSGMQPVIMEGRDGAQYLNYMQSQVSEMYQASNVMEDGEEKISQMDPYALLFRSMRDKKKFSLYAEKFEDFLISVCGTYLDLARHYLPDDAIIAAVGRSEAINIAEFKSSEKLCYKIELEAQTDDIESKMGRQLALNHVIQYVGPQLGKENIGKLVRQMPYANDDESLSDLTMDYDNATNDILALDRGELPQPGPTDDHVYVVKRLATRMKQSDFRMLSPQIQNNYNQVKTMHEQMEAEKQAAIQAAKSEYIPASGPLVGVDVYVDDPANPQKSRRARVPYQAVDWLIKKLETQGMGTEALDKLDSGSLAEIGNMTLQRGQQANPQMKGSMNGNSPQQQSGSFNPYSGGQPGPIHN